MIMRYVDGAVNETYNVDEALKVSDEGGVLGGRRLEDIDDA